MKGQIALLPFRLSSSAFRPSFFQGRSFCGIRKTAFLSFPPLIHS